MAQLMLLPHNSRDLNSTLTLDIDIEYSLHGFLDFSRFPPQPPEVAGGIDVSNKLSHVKVRDKSIERMIDEYVR